MKPVRGSLLLWLVALVGVAAGADRLVTQRSAARGRGESRPAESAVDAAASSVDPEEPSELVEAIDLRPVEDHETVTVSDAADEAVEEETAPLEAARPSTDEFPGRRAKGMASRGAGGEVDPFATDEAMEEAEVAGAGEDAAVVATDSAEQEPRRSVPLADADFFRQRAVRTASRETARDRGARQVAHVAGNLLGAGGVREAVATESRAPLAMPPGVTAHWQLPTALNIGQPTTCELVLTNGSATEVAEVRVVVKLPESVQMVSSEPALAEGERGSWTWEVGSLAAGARQTLAARLVPTTAGPFAPRAEVTCTAAFTAEAQAYEPQLAVTLQGAEEISVAQSQSYEVLVRNDGAAAAMNVVLHVKLPESLSHKQGGRVQYRLGTLAAGESRMIHVPVTAIKPGECQLEAAVTTGEYVAQRGHMAIRVAQPQLELAMEGPRLRYVQRKANYFITVHNPGPAPADNVQVLQQVPPTCQFVEASAGGSYDPQTRQVGWFIGRLEAEQSAKVALQLIPTVAGDEEFEAVVTADPDVEAAATTSTKVEGVSSLVMEVVDADDPIEVSGRTSYELRVTNTGTIAAREVQVAAQVPAAMQATDVSGPTAGEIRDQQVVFEPCPELAAGETLVYTVSVLCAEAGQTSFQAFVRSADQPEPTQVEETTRVYRD